MARIKYNSSKSSRPSDKGGLRVPAGYRDRSRSPHSDANVNYRRRDERYERDYTDSNRTNNNNKPFPYERLPTEVRAKALREAVAQRRAEELAELTIPKIMHVTKEVRREAMPIWFASNTFSVEVRSEWCSACYRFHEGHHRDAGKITLSKVLPQANNSDSKIIKESDVRFRKIRIIVNAGKCHAHSELPWPVGILSLEIDGQTPTSHFHFDLEDDEDGDVVLAFEMMHTNARYIVEDIGYRKEFKGYTIQDIKDVAECFKHL